MEKSPLSSSVATGRHNVLDPLRAYPGVPARSARAPLQISFPTSTPAHNILTDIILPRASAHGRGKDIYFPGKPSPVPACAAGFFRENQGSYLRFHATPGRPI